MYPNLKLQLWMSGIRQNRLAKMLEIDETTLSKIVNGFRQPTPEVRGRIASALKTDEKWLFQTIAEKLDRDDPSQKLDESPDRTPRGQKTENRLQPARHGANPA